jgi:hypothetical protein
MKSVTKIMVLGLLCAVLAGIATVGCGEGQTNEEDVATALGGDGDDGEQLIAVLESVSAFPETQASFLVALRARDLNGAESAISEMGALVDEGLDLNEEVASSELRGTLDSYLNTVRRYVDSAQVLVGHVAKKSGAVETQAAALELRDAAAATRTADRALIAQITAELPEEDRAQLEAAIQASKDRQREIIGAAAG